MSAAALRHAAERALAKVTAQRTEEAGAEVGSSGKGNKEVGSPPSDDPGGKEGTEQGLETEAGINLEKEDEGSDGEPGNLVVLDLEELYGLRPEGWMHSASLVFAIFGRPAGDDQDQDLSLKMTSGVTGGVASSRKRKEADTVPTGTEGEELGTPPPARLSTKHLQLMNGAGGSSSRADVKKLKHEVNSENKKSKADDADAELKRRALTAMTAPHVESKTSLALCASVQALTEAVVSKELLDQEEAKRRRYDAKVQSKEKKLEMWERRGKGDTPEAQALVAELEELYDNPVVAPVPAAAPPLGTANSATPNSTGEGGQEVAAGGGGGGGGGGAHDAVGVLSEDAAGVDGSGSGAGAGGRVNDAQAAGGAGDVGVGVNERAI